MKTRVRKPQVGQSLTTMLAIAFFALSTVVLLISSGSQMFFNIQNQRETIANKQQLIAQDAAKTVTSFIQEKFGVLETTGRLIDPTTVSPEAQRQILSSLLGLQPAFRHLILLDAQGRDLVMTSRLSQAASGQFADQLKGDMLAQIQQQQRYIGPIDIDEATREPMMIIAVPVTNALGDFEGTLVAEVNLKFMWDLVDQIKVGEAGWAYVVDRQGRLIASRERETNRVLKSENVSHLQAVGEFVQNPAAVSKTGISTYQGITGVMVVGTYVPLGMPDWAVITEVPWTEAYYEVIWQAGLSIGITLIMAVLAGLLGGVLARRMAVPLINLTETATRIATGEMELQAKSQGTREIVSLATAFNSMTAQLRESIDSLEQRVANRTQRLEMVATLSGHLINILELDHLLHELVTRTKEAFDYYYVQILLLDDAGEYLVPAASSSAERTAIETEGFSIALNAANPIARAVRSGEVLYVADVREVEDWMVHPQLPDAQAEITIPIILEGHVVGVLDVLAEESGKLDEGDVDLLQSLANHLSSAMNNAQLFEAVEQARQSSELAKAEAEIAKERAEEARAQVELQMWQTAGQAQLSEEMSGVQSLDALANSVTRQLCQYLQAQAGSLYLLENQVLRLLGGYAHGGHKDAPEQFAIGQGLVGQVAVEKSPILLSDIPQDVLTLTSSFGEIAFRHIVATPFLYEGAVIGVVELGALEEFTTAQLQFLETAMERIGVAFSTAQTRARVDELLITTQQQAKELEVQSEELQATNEELAAQTESLRASEARLRENQVQLEEANTELEEKAAALQKQQDLLDRHNRELRAAQIELEQRAADLAQASKYKSEFLANMSHELRTPLNSLLILAGMLKNNEEGNLIADQVESLEVIHKSGRDLLALINDILDLSKIEAGRMEFHFEPVVLREVLDTMRAQFAHVAEERGVAFPITLEDGVPTQIASDGQRVKQIIKNLLSNAFKFTEAGSVSLRVAAVGDAVALSVTDTGIGIAPEQQQHIFEAFQQADGSTSRKYGGTGLGLSISRELAHRLGGRIELQSAVGEGSTFTLYLPREAGVETQETEDQNREIGGWETRDGSQEPGVGSREAATAPLAQAPAPSSPPLTTSIPDDRELLAAGDRVLLIIEDDPQFAKIVYDYAHKKAFKCLVASTGESGLHLVQTYQPDAITLDLNLPDISGWEVLQRLKDNPDIRHIPVHVVSVEDESLTAYERGAIGFLTKPSEIEELAVLFDKIQQFIERQVKSVLLVEDDANLRYSVKQLLTGSDVEISEVNRGQMALDLLASRHFDCMVLDLSLPDISGFEVLQRLHDAEEVSKCPVIVYTGRELTPKENQELLKYANSVIIKGVKSPERLLDETTLFLHQVVANMSEKKRQTIKRLHSQEAIFEGKTIMLVDDDMRNTFALSKLLRQKGLNVYIAPNGQRALDLLADDSHVDLVLMDVMMPVMDGLETTRRIRAQAQFRNLPILALTAKAMKGDREKCLEAGANDYLPKPVEAARLFSMLRVWLYHSRDS